MAFFMQLKLSFILKGIKAKSHSVTRALFGEYIVKPRIMGVNTKVDSLYYQCVINSQKQEKDFLIKIAKFFKTKSIL